MSNKTIKSILYVVFLVIVLNLFGKHNPDLGERYYEKPPCSDFTSEEIIGFYPISLKFEDQKMKSTFGDYQFYELNNYHRGAFKNSGEITLLNDLINDLTDRLDSIHRPYIKATITGTHCIGNVDYTVTESSKVVGNNLFGVKVINQMYFKSISIVVRTIKTSIDGYYVMWNANIVGGQQQGELSSTSTKYGGVVGQYIIGRDVYTICFRSLNNSFYTPIPNTMPSNMNTDDLTTLINSGKLKPVTIQVPSLSKPVYVKGQLQTTLTWNNSIYAL